MSLEDAVEAAIAACTTLSPRECHHFLDNGYVVVKQAFSAALAAEIREAATQVELITLYRAFTRAVLSFA
jgi:ATP-dependent exoDNAse (exonuclease V) beta subunit